jgi:predicted enzyme related to lactoylglutathione lyase
MAKVVHFEITATNPARAAKFYTKVFGWKISKWGKQEYWVVDAGPKKEEGINGGIVPRKGIFKKAGGYNAFVCTIQVKKLDEIAKKVKKAGGKWADEGGLVHGVGFMQYFVDTEGNLFGALQPDTKAKMVP